MTIQETISTLCISFYVLFVVTQSFIKGYLQISAERLIKIISELRHKICQARQHLEQETEVKLNTNVLINDEITY